MWGILADTIGRLRPDLWDTLHLSFGLSDAARLGALFVDAGFNHVRVARETRADVVESFDDYWKPIEAGVGSIPQAYLALAHDQRRQVREEVRSKLARFASQGKLQLSVDMLIAVGQA